MRPSTPFLCAALAATPSMACTSSGFNIFTIQDDIDLGKQVRDEIEADPETYPLMDESENPEAYEYMYAIRDTILASGEVEYAEDFDWELYIIDDDETLNAFCAPGGYIYVYTGLISFLPKEDYFAGVLGHEMAHADRRHSTKQLTKVYGVSTLMEVVLGEDPGLAAQIAAALLTLQFSRTDEAEADEYSVRYLCNTPYAANGAAGFFELLEGWEVPEFLSTHPSSDSRVEDINAWAEQLGCSTELNPDTDWNEFLQMLGYDPFLDTGDTGWVLDTGDTGA